MSNVNQNQSKKSYFNQTLDGVGYLNRIEWLTPENGDPYLVATINSVVGPESKTWNTRFDCTVASTAREDLEFISANVTQQNSSTQSGRACSTRYKVAAARDLSLFVGSVSRLR